MNKQVLQDLMQNIEARKQTEQRLKATVRSWMSHAGYVTCRGAKTSPSHQIRYGRLAQLL